MEKIAKFWVENKGKVKLVVAFVLGGLAAIGYNISPELHTVILSLVQ